jgi:hypothetical protein
MKNFIVLAMVSVLAACSSAPKDAYERRAYEERERQEKYAEAAIDKAPKWMTELPKSKSAIYASATETSSNMSMADEKAKQHAFGNICMAAGGEVDKQSKLYRADVGEQSVENSSVAIRGMCRTVDISGAEIVEIKRVAEGPRFRTFVLVALPTGTANAVQQRKDQQRAQVLVQRQSDAAYRDMDSKAKKPE